MAVIRSFTILLLVFYVGVMPCLAKEADPKIVAEIKEVMDKHAKALETKDISTIMEMYAQDHHTMWMASRPGDLWVGKENIKAAYLQFFDSFDREVVSYNWVSIGSEGNTAWFVALCDATAYVKNEKVTFGVNWSAVLKKQGGKWFFIASHTSNPIPDETK